MVLNSILSYKVQRKWESGAPHIFDWFCNIQSAVTSIVYDFWESAGIDRPPGPFYTNDTEMWTGWSSKDKLQDISSGQSFAELAQQLVKEQESDIEKAVIRIGEYRFKDE